MRVKISAQQSARFEGRGARERGDCGRERDRERETEREREREREREKERERKRERPIIKRISQDHFLARSENQYSNEKIQPKNQPVTFGSSARAARIWAVNT